MQIRIRHCLQRYKKHCFVFYLKQAQLSMVHIQSRKLYICMSVDNNYANFERRLAANSCTDLKKTSRSQQCHIEQSLVQVLDITEVCTFLLCFHFHNILYYIARTGSNLTENRDVLKLIRFFHKIINNSFIKIEGTCTKSSRFQRDGTLNVAVNQIALFPYKRKETSPRLAPLPITRKPSLKEGCLLFMVGGSSDNSAPQTERSRETLGWNVRRNCNYGQTRTSSCKLPWNFQVS